MIYSKARNQLLIVVLVVGFFVGILYENFDKTIHFFEEEQLKIVREMNYKIQEYALYIIKIRLIPLSGIIFLKNLRWRRSVILFINGFCGFLIGRIMVAAIIVQGIKGIVIAAMVLFPHILFYAIAYMIVVLHLYNEKKRKWSKSQIVAIIIFFILGILSEIYINPRILKIVFRFAVQTKLYS